jgi:hypothetical protein
MTLFLFMLGGFLGTCLGSYLGFKICRYLVARHFKEMISTFLEEEIERKGIIAFADGQLSIHCLSKKDFDLFASNMLKYYQPTQEM